jgi:hypothetical protein
MQCTTGTKHSGVYGTYWDGWDTSFSQMVSLNLELWYRYGVVRLLKGSVADPDPGSGIRDWVLFDPWIRDPE